ncbi:dipeptidase [Bradyrhizobium sp. 1.29L]
MIKNMTPIAAAFSDIPGLGEAILCDMLLPRSLAGDRTPSASHVENIEAHRRNGFSFLSLTMAGDDEAAPSQIYSRLANWRYRIGLHADKFTLVDSVEAIRAAKKNSKLAIRFNFQGSEALGRDLANVGAYYKLGVGVMGLAYNYHNNVGTGSLEAEQNDIGLSKFGKALIVEMNRVGMIVDCSHTGYRTTMDAMSASTQPCIFSHSNPRALSDHPRNIRDDQIKACAENRGVIGIHGVGPFMGEQYAKKCTADALVRQIDYVAQLVGAKHVALGLDYSTPADNKWIIDNLLLGDTSKMGLPAEQPWGFFDPAELSLVLKQLLDKGYSVDDVTGIMGENFLRVAAQVWK